MSIQSQMLGRTGLPHFTIPIHFRPVCEIVSSIDASGRSFGSSGTHGTGVGCRKALLKQNSIDFANITK